MKYKVWKKKFRDANNQVQEKYFACKATNATVSTKKMAEDIKSEGLNYVLKLKK